MKQVSVDELTFEQFAARLDASFRVQLNQSTTVELKLVTATPHPAARSGAAGAGDRPVSFSLVFTGPADRLLPQRTYAFEQDQLGSFDLFIVPIGKDSARFSYEAIFNRAGRPGS